MLPRKYLKIFSLLLLTSSIIGCATPQETIVVRNKYIDQNIQIQPKPKPVEMIDLKFYAVTEDTLDQFLQKFEKENGDIVFFAISVPGYENLSLNVAELRRYIEQQKSLIVYYENNIKSNQEASREVTEEVVQKGTLRKIKETLGID